MEEALIRKILNNNPILKDNPMALNAIGLFRNGQVADLEMLARNILKYICKKYQFIQLLK